MGILSGFEGRFCWPAGDSLFSVPAAGVVVFLNGVCHVHDDPGVCCRLLRRPRLFKFFNVPSAEQSPAPFSPSPSARIISL